MKHSVSMKDIAERAGCSSVAVSKALRNDPEISLKTREKIQRIANEMNYRPNPLVSALMASRGSRGGKSAAKATIAVLSHRPMDRGEQERHINYVEQYAGVRSRASELGFHIEIIDTQEGALSPDRMSKILYARGIRGLVVFPDPRLLPYMEAICSWLPAAVIGDLQNFEAYPVVRTASFGNMTMALEKMGAAGYRRIGLLTNSGLEQAVSFHYYAAYVAYAKFTKGVRTIPPYIFAWDEKRISFADWFAKHRPEALIGKIEAVPIVESELGIRIPEDIAFAVMDHKKRDVDYAGFDSRHDLQGEAAIDMVSGLIFRNELVGAHASKHLVVRGQWVDGPSLPAKDSGCLN